MPHWPIVLAVASVGVYGIVLAGWSSGSPYPLLGGLRSSAQVISYEIAMGLSLVAVFIMSGSMSTSAIVDAQSSTWFVISAIPSFLVYVVTMVGETNRLPFDLAEGEGEIVGGFHTEYGSMRFAMFFLGEYVNMFTVSALATTMFLGGWQSPPPLGLIADGALNGGWWGLLWFTIKIWLFIFLFVWLLILGALMIVLRLRLEIRQRFVWLLFGIGLVLSMAVDLVVLKGDIGRMNTVFKFYLQLWVFWSVGAAVGLSHILERFRARQGAVSYTHLRAHETVLDLVCRLLLEKKKQKTTKKPQH